MHIKRKYNLHVKEQDGLWILTTEFDEKLLHKNKIYKIWIKTKMGFSVFQTSKKQCNSKNIDGFENCFDNSVFESLE